MPRRTFALLLATLALAGCVGAAGPVRPGAGYAVQPGAALPGEAVNPAAASGTVALLVPLSGPRADIAQALQHAAELALSAPGSPKLDVRDTAGTPQGAATAAQAAIAGGAGMLLGPLTSPETAAVAPIAGASGVPVLAFTNDPAQARPGIWPLGITPRQQVFRLVATAQAQGKSRFAALLPDSDFGRAMAASLQEAAGAASLEPPTIRFHPPGMAAITSAMRDVADYAGRGGALDARIRAARARDDVDGRREAAELAGQRGAVPPPPFDTLLLADAGEPLSEIVSLLSYVDVSPAAVRIVGPALWADPSSGSGQLPGAWYAAPDPAARAPFSDSYAGKFGTPPRAIADLAFDAASIARVLAQSGGFTVPNLTQPAGFAGSDGLLALEPDGRVRRALAVFELQRGGGAQIVEPAPQAFSAPGT